MLHPPKTTLTPSILPGRSQEVFTDTSYFARHANLPSPQEVRGRAQQLGSGACRHASSRPPPVTFPSLNLFVKYGRAITIAEGQCLWAVGRLLRGAVPVPEVFGWTTDSGEVFLYMEMMHGVTLESRYDSLTTVEKTKIARQMDGYIRALRTLTQAPQDPFIGHIGRQPLLDIMFDIPGWPPAGPFPSVPALLDWMADMTHRPQNRGKGLPLDPVRYEVPDDIPIVFTHNDLHRRNIIVSAEGDGEVHVVAIVDWHQSGWLPEYWEWCKAYWCIPPNDDWANYLSLFLRPFDKFPYWSYFSTCYGM